MVSPPPLDVQRAELRRTVISAERRHRVLLVGRAVGGPPGAVPGLVRGLQDLGHTVFHLDPDVVPKAVAPSPGGGGRLQVARIRTVLDTFRPQVLVLCGGGTVLDEAGAVECAGRGLVTLAMTLDDADVVDPTGGFDYLVTHSAHAQAAYRRAGVQATLLLLPGVDRATAVIETTPAADVVVVGPVSLDRVAGLGASVTAVAGDPVRGALEAAVAGAVLCVPDSGQVSELFEPDEVLTYCDDDDLVSRLEALLSTPEGATGLTRRVFRRVVGEHLHEHRWLRLLTAIGDDVASAAPLVGSARAAEIAEVLAVEHPESRTVLVSGYFGAGNRGDDLLLEALAAGVERDLPGATVVVAARNAAAVMLKHGRPAFDRRDLVECDDHAARAGALVIGPGGLWDDYSIRRAGGVAGVVGGAEVSPAHLAQLAVLVRAHGGDVHVFGMGAGPLRDDAARSVVRLTGDLASSVVVRDQASADLVRGIDGWATPVSVAPDVCYALTLPEPEDAVPEGRYLAVSVRPWDPEPRTAERVLDAVATVAEEQGLAVVGVPMQHRDVLTLRSWAEAHPGTPMTVLPVDAPLSELCATLRGATAVVAMRLHAAVLAHRLGSVCVGVAYDPKVAAHFTDLGCPDQVVGLPVDPEGLAGLLRAAVSAPRLSEQTVGLVAERERGAVAALADLAARLATAPRPSNRSGVAAYDRARRVPSVVTADGGHADRAAVVTRDRQIGGAAGRVRRRLSRVLRRVVGR